MYDTPLEFQAPAPRITVSFKYDPFGRRIYKSSSSGTSVYAYDGDDIIEQTNSSGAAVARYTQTQSIDEPLAMLRSSTTSYHHADGLGSVTSLSNSAGVLAQTYGYDSFGKQTSSSGSLTNPFQFAARESDSETGLYYYRARYYEPATGHFLSEDPIRFVEKNAHSKEMRDTGGAMKKTTGACGRTQLALGALRSSNALLIARCRAKASLRRLVLGL